MNRKVITAKATQLLSLLSSCSILMPFSGQGMLQIEVPLREYVLFVRSMCEANKFLYSAVGNITTYRKALNAYDNMHNLKPIQVLFTFDMHVAGVMELKKAISRNRQATLIVLNYDDSAPYLSLDDMYSIFSGKFQTEEGRNLVIKTIQSINRVYDAIPIDINRLSEHNRDYYCYLSLLHYNIQYASKGNKFEAFNINT